MTRSERFAASTQQVSPLPIPLPLQNEVVDERRLLTVPWVSTFQWILNIGTRTFVTGTHADRIDDKNDPAQYRPGTWFWETDRTVLYQVRIVADEPQWVYVLGTMEAPKASRPTDLGPYDAGFQFAATDTGQLYLWDGTAWVDITAYPLVIYGTHAERLAEPVAALSDGALWVETDRGNALYQLQTGVWWYIAGTMFGTLVPDQRPADLGVHDAGFAFRTSVPPAQEFMWSQTAWVEITPAADNTSQWVQASAPLTLTTTMADIPGLALTLPRTGVYLVSGVFDFNSQDANALLLGQLTVNGVAQGMFAISQSVNVPARMTVAQQWRVSAIGNVPIKLQANKNGGVGGSLAHVHSTLSAVWVGN